MLAGQVDYVIGGVVDDLQCPTDAMGYKRCRP